MINSTYSTATNFAMFIPGSEYSNLQMRVINFKIPNVSSTPVEQDARFIKAKHPGSTAKFEDLSVNVLVDSGLTNVIPVHSWMINNITENNAVKKDITLIGYSSSETQLFTVEFKSAFPTSINIDTFNAQDGSDSLIKASINFVYDYYEYN